MVNFTPTPKKGGTAVNQKASTAWNTKNLLDITDSSLASVRYLLENTVNLLNSKNLSLYATTGIAALALAVTNLLAGALGFTIAANSTGQLAAAGKMKSDKGAFDTPVSSTDVYCTNLQCYNNATTNHAVRAKGNFYCNTGTIFGSDVDMDYAKISTFHNVPKFESSL